MGSEPMLDAKFVYCEGGPASDSLRALKGVLPYWSWNHRLLAVYRGDDKFVLDLETSEVHHWEVTGDADLAASSRSLAMTRRPLAETFSARTRPRKPPGAIASPWAPRRFDVVSDEPLRAWG